MLHIAFAEAIISAENNLFRLRRCWQRTWWELRKTDCERLWRSLSLSLSLFLFSPMSQAANFTVRNNGSNVFAQTRQTGDVSSAAIIFAVVSMQILFVKSPGISLWQCSSAMICALRQSLHSMHNSVFSANTRKIGSLDDIRMLVKLFKYKNDRCENNKRL